MSVINKMLRDLDRRHAPGGGLAAAGNGLLGLTPHQGASPAPSAPTPLGAMYIRWLIASALAIGLLALGAGLWWNQTRPAPQAIEVAATPAPVPVPKTAPVALRSEVRLSRPETVKGATPEARPAQRTAATAVPVGGAALRPASPSKASPAVAALPPTPPVPTDAATLSQTSNQAASDAMAHGQSLWASGARDAAIAWMTQVVANARSAGSQGDGAATTQHLLASVRELARMQLAQANPQAVWDLLTGLEGQLGNQADVWALRANAAQRLDRHQDSVHAYMTALQLRPNEQRWLLGAAVSLAALGKTDSAAELAEKARALGVVSPEVLAYLRQMGVPVKE